MSLDPEISDHITEQVMESQTCEDKQLHQTASEKNTHTDRRTSSTQPLTQPPMLKLQQHTPAIPHSHTCRVPPACV